MSIKVMTAVWEHSKATGTDLLVLLALADMANDEGECWPSMSTIGKRARLAPRNARDRIKSLARLGEVVVIPNGGKTSSAGGLRSNRYRITVHMDPEDDTDASIPIDSDPIRTPASLSANPDTDASILQIGMPASPLIRMPASAEPSVEPSGNRQSLAPASPTPVVRKRDELFDAVAEVCGIESAELTKSARGAMNKALKDLRDVGARPGEVTDRAAAFRRQYRSATLTPAALAKHWPQLSADSNRATDPLARAVALAQEAGR